MRISDWSSDVCSSDLFGLVGRIVGRRGGDVEQTAGAFEMILAPGAGEQAIVADAVESARQGVEQEAANELVSGQRHDLLAVGAALAIIFISEGRSEERRVGKECVSTCRSRWRPEQ